MNEPVRKRKTTSDGMILTMGGGLKIPSKDFCDRIEKALKSGEELGYKKPCEFIKIENQT